MIKNSRTTSGKLTRRKRRWRLNKMRRQRKTSVKRVGREFDEVTREVLDYMGSLGK
jgi:hypothetical protein